MLKVEKFGFNPQSRQFPLTENAFMSINVVGSSLYVLRAYGIAHNSLNVLLTPAELYVWKSFCKFIL